MKELAERIAKIPDVGNVSVERAKEKFGEKYWEHTSEMYQQLLGEFKKSGTVYIEARRMRGVENCNNCGKMINMGYFTIKNPKSGKEVSLPYMGLHALESHDSIGYNGDMHMGTVPVDEILAVLEGK